jgi:hypothetical protein
MSPLASLLVLQTVPESPLNALVEAAKAFIDQNRSLFLDVGTTLYTSFAVILIVWVGVKIALSGEFDASRFASFIMMLAFGKALLFYWNGGPFSLPDLVMGQADWLSKRIDQRAVSELGAAVDHLINAPPAGVLSLVSNVAGSAWWLAEVVALVLLQIVAHFVIAYGEIALAVCILLGPIFLPFFIVPKLDWLFWGWFKAFIQYSFYRVVASAVVFMVSQAMHHIFSPPATAAIQAALNPAQQMVDTVAAGVCVASILKIPSLVSNIFSGSAGSDGGAVAIMQSAVRSAVAIAA